MRVKRDVDAIDHDALERALAILQADPERAEQITSMLSDRAWLETAHFAAYVCQRRTLRLRPWQSPPMDAEIGEPRPHDHGARVLLRRMRSAGLSRFEPDPVAALDELKKKRA